MMKGRFWGRLLNNEFRGRTDSINNLLLIFRKKNPQEIAPAGKNSYTVHVFPLRGHMDKYTIIY